ncbi:MAG: ABC-2 family transporter protein [Clostridia bacterium]|nr:ABC-2 family transporter protein [Clostridia bacterium]
MADKIRSVLRLLRLYARMDLNWVLQDFKAALIVICAEIINNLTAVSGILLLAVRFGGAGGLTADEILLMLGFFELADGLCYMLFGGFNVLHISRRIGRGQLDHMLIQPRPLPVQLLTEGFMPVSGSGGFLIGILLTAAAWIRLQLAVTPLRLFLLLLYILCHILLTLGQSFLFGSAAFRNPAAGEELSTLILDLNGRLGRFPLFGLPRWLLGLLCTVLPVGLLAYLPSLALLGRLSGLVLALPVCVATAFALAAAGCFRAGIRHYLQYSCNRYKGMGHRS